MAVARRTAFRTLELARGLILYRATLEVPHFIMERGMLLGIKSRAESAVTAVP